MFTPKAGQLVTYGWTHIIHCGDMILKRILERLPFSNRFFPAIVLTAILFATGCADMRGYLAKSPPLPEYPADAIQWNDFVIAKDEDVLGRLATIRLERGDTLPDIARHFSLGIDNISAANPGIDIWVPGAWERILLSLNFILPDTRRNGIVINLAAMRLFHYQENGHRLAVSTYPVGVGTEERPTPSMRARSRWAGSWVPG